MTEAEFMAQFGRVYEHSPWVAEALWRAGMTPAHDATDVFARAMAEIVEKAPRERQLSLLISHPDLAGRLAMQDALTAESTVEQASAGLDKCSPEEFARFSELNHAYRTRFGFPFIMAVKGKARSEILTAFERRISNDRETEFRTALAEVHQIAQMRLRDL
jgi:OHCU decarboxylase